ncbi:MAG: amidohydrolase family protein, partial [Candidatus Sumerlaeia bacterium]|nr:amidohydrolase family protein [Candidatus Sumerlaeia bacterium]
MLEITLNFFLELNLLNDNSLYIIMFRMFKILTWCVLCLWCLSPIFILATDSVRNRECFDLIIRNGKVIDGTGNGWFFADIGINSGQISAIGDLRDSGAREEIDATGLIVAPGFIDPHTHADTALLNLPYAENFVRDGVTTIITGNCGSSVRNIAGFFNDLMTTGVAVNVATLIGHNTILRQVKGDAATSLTLEQFEQCKSLLRQAMLDGALGMSTGLIYAPGRYSSTQEIIKLQKVVAELGGIYATHMRSESGEILEAIDEALLVGREAGCRIQISHLKIPGDNKIGGSQTLLNKILTARMAGQEVWIDQYPYT